MQRRIVLGLLAAATLLCGLLYLIGINAEVGLDRRRAFAIAMMTTGLLVAWVFVGGWLMVRFRAEIRRWVLAIPVDWRLKFVLFATVLACLEEAVTVTLTNLAPVFGSQIGEAYITASADYFDVIAFHSVVVFVPFFISIAALLSFFDFKPFAIFLGFGLVGTFAEAVFLGSPAALVMFPFWVFVYGLMVWLPATCLPVPRRTRPAGLVPHLLLAPAILLLALPMVAPLVYLIAVVLKHPSIDFVP